MWGGKGRCGKGEWRCEEDRETMEREKGCMKRGCVEKEVEDVEEKGGKKKCKNWNEEQ